MAIAERASGGARAAVATLTATHAGPWGLGVYVQTSNGQCVLPALIIKEIILNKHLLHYYLD